MYTITICIPHARRLIRTNTPDRAAAIATWARIKRTPGSTVRLWHNSTLIA